MRGAACASASYAVKKMGDQKEGRKEEKLWGSWVRGRPWAPLGGLEFAFRRGVLHLDLVLEPLFVPAPPDLQPNPAPPQAAEEHDVVGQQRGPDAVEAQGQGVGEPQTADGNAERGEKNGRHGTRVPDADEDALQRLEPLFFLVSPPLLPARPHVLTEMATIPAAETMAVVAGATTSGSRVKKAMSAWRPAMVPAASRPAVARA